MFLVENIIIEKKEYCWYPYLLLWKTIFAAETKTDQATVANMTKNGLLTKSYFPVGQNDDMTLLQDIW